VILVRAKDLASAKKITREYYDSEEPYENAAGGMTHYRMVRVLDAFELIDELTIPKDEPVVEVYSRHLLVPKNLTIDEIVKKYHLDM
jgi:hypothetical protein